MSVERVMPDFDAWADAVASDAYFAPAFAISRALQQAFNQGLAMGHLDARYGGLDDDWVQEWDKGYADKNQD